MEERIFKAPMDRANKLLTFFLGYVVLIGIPVVISVTLRQEGRLSAATGVIVAFIILIAFIHSFRITGFKVTSTSIVITRLIKDTYILISEIQSIERDPSPMRNFTLRLFGMSGIYGSQGIFWNKELGVFRAYVMSANNVIDLQLKNGKHVFISPHPKDEFIKILNEKLV